MQTVITYLVDFVVLFLCTTIHVHIHPTSVASSRANSTPIMAPSSVTVLLTGDVNVGWVLTACSVPVIVESVIAVAVVGTIHVVEAVVEAGSITGGCSVHSLLMFTGCKCSQA